MSHVQLAMLTLGETVGKVCDLESDSKMLRDLTVQPALSPALVPDQVLVFGKVVRHRLWDVLPGLCLGFCACNFN